MSGIIGYELFSHFVVEIDYANGFINLFEPQNYRYNGTETNISADVTDQTEKTIRPLSHIALPNGVRTREERASLLSCGNHFIDTKKHPDRMRAFETGHNDQCLLS